MIVSSGATVLAEKWRVNYIRIVQRWNFGSRVRCDESGSSMRSRVTAVGAQAAGFERRAGKGDGRFCARQLEFAQGVHRLRTVVNPSSQFSVLSSQCCGAIVKRRAARLRQPASWKTVLVVSIRPHCVRACTFKPTTGTELVHPSDNYVRPVACIEPRMRLSL